MSREGRLDAAQRWFDGDFGPESEMAKAAPSTPSGSTGSCGMGGGLTEIIEGTRIRPRFHNVFASEYWFDAYDLPYPKRVITDTGKTQYLFRINKGIENLGENINQHMPEAERPIPFANMIYFGDGDTDVPSMAVMRKNVRRMLYFFIVRGYHQLSASTSFVFLFPV